jgi:hypothetical protein
LFLRAREVRRFGTVGIGDSSWARARDGFAGFLTRDGFAGFLTRDGFAGFLTRDGFSGFRP